MPSPHLSSRAVVGVATLLLAVGVGRGSTTVYGFPTGVRLRSWPAVLFRRLRRDLAGRDGRAAAWVGLALWSAGVCVLHFGGLRHGLYSSIPWWDLLTHSTSGVGVAAALVLTFRRAPGHAWVVPTVFAVGAGFEVYEFAFRSFWHAWTLEFYVVDTVVDLLLNAVGASAVVAAARARAPSGAAADDRSDEPRAHRRRAPAGE